MRHVSEIAKELGFNEDAPETVQHAFVRHLMRAAGVPPLRECAPKSTSAQPSSNKKSVASNAAPQQLSFHFDNLEDAEAIPTEKIGR